jgi:hemerythrin
MAIIQWTTDLSVGVAEIDQQHQKLISIINDLDNAMAQKKGREVLRGVIQKLISYAQSHFKTEEEYFDQFGYEDSAAHKAQHVGFIKEISGFCEDYFSGKSGLSVSLMNFLGEWLVDHIKGADQKYVACFNRNGLH